ncbi:TonB-dependent receptor [Thermophagus sp. OGC60D27]|uniref:TonB-dependent receptor n=1 Tax=Thermophagus sp. OGC60D27 TaxID=3458415 RepID=UPI004037AD7B
MSLLVTVLETVAQNHCVRGWVREADSGEPVSDVHIWATRSGKGTITDSSGAFEICFDKNEVLIISHATYDTQRLSLVENDKDSVFIYLNQRDVVAREVEVRGRRETAINPVLPSTGSIKSKDILLLPSLLGEADVVGALRQLPGIQSVSEGIGGVFVRGGSPGQNRVLLDGMELLNPVHLMGVYSVFNPLITRGVEVFKGHSPVSVRSGLSSSILVTSDDPISGDQGVKGAIGNIASNLTLSLQSRNGKFGITAGARRSYLEVYREASSLFLKEDDNYFDQSFYWFYDFNGRMVFQPHPGSQFVLSWYVGVDDFVIDNDDVDYDAGTNYGNNAVALQWRKRMGVDGSLKISADYTSAWSDFTGEIIQNDLDFTSRHQKLSLSAEMLNEYRSHLIRYGAEGAWYKTMPQKLFLVITDDTTQRKDIYRNYEVSWFLEDNFHLLPKISLYAGIRGYYYASLGPYQYNGDVDFTDVGAGETIDHDWLWSSSLSVSYSPGKSSTCKIAWTRSVQLRHLAALSSMPLPNDLWMMASPRLKPQIGHQWSVEYERVSTSYDWRVGAFARLMRNQLIFNVNIDGEEMNFEDHFYKGRGRAYGLEWSLRKKAGPITGALNYTMSKSERSFNDIFDGVWFNDKFDRTHDLTVLVTGNLSGKWSCSANWTYATGISMNLPSGRMWMMGTIMNDYDSFNNFRLPPYHRLDLSASLKLNSDTFKESVLDFSVINVYNRANPYFLFYKVSKGNSNYDIDIQARQISLFPIMPSLSWKFKF